MLPSLVRLADYMITESLVTLVLNNLGHLLALLAHPNKSKGVFLLTVNFVHELTTFTPDEPDVLKTVNSNVVEGILQSMGSMPRLMFMRAFAPLFEAGAGPPGSHNAGGGGKFEGLSPMAVLTSEPEYQRMCAEITACVTSSFVQATEYTASFEDNRTIYNFGLRWNQAEYEATPKSVAQFRADMRVQREWRTELDRMKVGSAVGMMYVDSRALRTDLTATVQSMLESMKALLLVASREEVSMAVEAFQKRVRSLVERPENLEKFAGFMEVHAAHEEAQPEYDAEHAVVEEMYDMLTHYEMKIPPGDQIKLDDLSEAVSGLADSMQHAADFVETRKAEMMSALSRGIAELDDALLAIMAQLNSGVFVDRAADPDAVLVELAKLQKQVTGHQEKVDMFRKYQALFKMPVDKFANLDQAVKEHEGKQEIWHALHEWEMSTSGWMSSAASGLDLDSINNTVDEAGVGAYKMLKARRDDQVVMRLREEVEAFKQYMPLIQEIANPALQPRHWEAVFKVLGQGKADSFDVKSDADALSVSTMIQYGIMDNMEAVENIGSSASKEYSLQKTLEKMQAEWEGLEFHCLPWKETGTYILGGSDEVQAILDDQIVKAQGMCASPFVKPFEEDAKVGRYKLGIVCESRVESALF